MTNKPMLSVERELIEQAMLACFEAGFGITHGKLRAIIDNPVCEKEFESDAICIESDGCPTEGAVLKRFWRENQPDTALCEFYEAKDYKGLVRELVGHVAQLQDAAKRNVKPWEDTFPPTLLPAYLARISAEQPAPVAEGTTSDKYKAELYDEVWQLARSMGFNNVTDALTGRVTPVEPESECTSCDGSGEYTDAIGDWRGYCTCPAGIEAESLKGDKP